MPPPTAPHAAPALQHQPASRPVQYPKEILWSLADAKLDEDVASSEGNMSRLSMGRVLRHPNGDSVSTGEYHAIKATAHAIAYDLNQLPIPHGRSHLGGTRTLRFYKSNMVADWNAAVARAESEQELLALCSAHWKAEHVLQAALQAAHESNKTKTNGSAISKRSRSNSAATSGSSKRPRSDSITNHAKAKLHIRVPEPLRDETDESPQPPPSTSTAKSMMATTKFTFTPTAKNLPTLLPTLVDSSPWIDITSSEHPDVTDAVDLLHALNANQAFMVGEPSSIFSAFLERVESATPVLTEEADENDSPEMWGHTQFAGGSMTCTSVLDTWASIGSSSFTYRLIAAALTTCRVSRWLCKRQLVPASTPVFYLSDNYLGEVCRLLWAAWKSAGGPIAKGKEKAASHLNMNQPQDTESASADSALRTALEGWYVPELRKWITEHKLTTLGTKKAALVDAICNGMDTQKPSLEVAPTGSEKRGKKTPSPT
ncbi:hypothetical protein FIBSPDRAFT_943135 [Athelia psychrophila]|uniref:Uncharacterized protein n=1 Tax=Athelia psychrophila TaxID=1759441 RepID=A0A166WSR1_9AGAM|nr:hypothetical protein FIBSPDRAFT_943135 [Fibularhizoctonia sp. CBS 109695]